MERHVGNGTSKKKNDKTLTGLGRSQNEAGTRKSPTKKATIWG